MHIYRKQSKDTRMLIQTFNMFVREERERQKHSGHWERNGQVFLTALAKVMDQPK